MADFWREGDTWHGTKLIDGVLYVLEERNDRSFAELHSYIWSTKSGAEAHLTEDERAQLPM